MNIAVTRAAEGFERRAFTVAEILRMVEAGIIAEDESIELIEGELVPMSPKGNQHEVVKLALNQILARQAPDELRLGIETTVYLDDRTFVEPDLCLYPKRILPEDVRGTDIVLAIEVAATSLGYDKGLKARLYARHGIREFWVIEAAKRVTWVHREPRPEGTWRSVEKREPDAVLTPEALPQLEIVVAALE